MNRSLSDSDDASFEEADESVTPKFGQLLHLSSLINELSYEPAVPNNVTQMYLQKVGF